jgi:LPS sulfotransferase NodH
MHFRRRGDVAEGWLVASGIKPIPDNYPNRAVMELTLSFTDQFGQPHAAQGQAILERSAQRKEKWMQRSSSQRPIDVPQGESENNRNISEMPCW